ncbi:hypothetical protein F5B19DRAFT_451112 [Rostrohypoxylon terebratum]|nr:hypothetical protein F5B19DRAFT_451112 [Rostrohypoxylon terebratum]
MYSDDNSGFTNDPFQAFASLDSQGYTQRKQPDPSHDLLTSMEDFLLSETTSNVAAAYKNCEEQHRHDIGMPRSQDGPVLLDYADSIFLFFFPQGFKGPTISKYWGGVHQLLQFTESPQSKDSALLAIKNELSNLTGEIGSLTQAFCYSSKEMISIDMPVELQQAWLHILMSLISFDGRDAKYERQSMGTWLQHIRIASHLIKKGSQNVVQSLKNNNPSQLRDRLIPLPIDIAWQASSDLLGRNPEMENTKKPLSADVVKIYRQCVESLQQAVSDKPWDRSHLKKITSLQEEISKIQEVFKEQERVLVEMISFQTELQESTGSGDHHDENPRPHSSGADTNVSPTLRSLDDDVDFEPKASYHNYFQGMVPQDCLGSTQRKNRQLAQLQKELLSFEIEAKGAIDDNKDQQASAVYAFTIVTVIFLPLSTVASIFGMNTNDIRNTDINQWLFWAVSLPITIVIVPLALLWAGGTGNFSAALVYWFSGGGSRRRGNH